MAYHLVQQPFHTLNGMSINVSVDMDTGELFPFFFYHNTIYSTTNASGRTVVVNVARPKEQLKYSIHGLPRVGQDMQQLQNILNEYEELFHVLMDNVNGISPGVIPSELLVKFTPPPILLPTVDMEYVMSDTYIRHVMQPRPQSSIILSTDKNWLLLDPNRDGIWSLQIYRQEKTDKDISWDVVESGPTINLHLTQVNELHYHRPTSMMQLLRQRRMEVAVVEPGLNSVEVNNKHWCHRSHYHDRSCNRLDIYTLRELFMLDGQLIEPEVTLIGDIAIPFYSTVPEGAIVITHCFGHAGRAGNNDKQPFELLRTPNIDLDETVLQRLHLQQRYPDWYEWLSFQTNITPAVATQEAI